MKIALFVRFLRFGKEFWLEDGKEYLPIFRLIAVSYLMVRCIQYLGKIAPHSLTVQIIQFTLVLCCFCTAIVTFLLAIYALGNLFYALLGLHERLKSDPKRRDNIVVWCDFVLHLCLTKKQMEIFLDDLHEEYLEIAEKFGQRRANFWYWKQAICSAWPLMNAKTKAWIKGLATAATGAAEEYVRRHIR